MLHKPSIPRIDKGVMDGKGLVALFEGLAAEAEEMHLDALDALVPYLEPDDEFKVGDYVPEMHLIVRKVTDE